MQPFPMTIHLKSVKTKKQTSKSGLNGESFYD